MMHARRRDPRFLPDMGSGKSRSTENEMTEENIQDPGTGTVPPPESAPESPAPSIADKVAGCSGKVDAAVGKCLGFVENHPWESWLAAANGFIGKFLPLVIAAAGVLAFAVGLVTAIRYDLPFSFVLGDFGILVATLFSMHLAPKAMALPRSFVEKAEPDAARPELLYIAKILFGLGGIVLAVWLVLQFDGDAFVAAVVTAVVSVLAIIVFSHPGLVGLKADYPTNAVEETITIVLFPLKLVLSLLTLVVGIVTVVLLVVGVVNVFSNGGEAFADFSAAALAPVVVPVGAYVAYLTVVFVLDLYRAIVSLPRKLDDLRKAVESK